MAIYEKTMVNINSVYEIALLKFQKGVFGSLVPLKRKIAQVYLIALIGILNSLVRAIKSPCFWINQSSRKAPSILQRRADRPLDSKSTAHSADILMFKGNTERTKLRLSSFLTDFHLNNLAIFLFKLRQKGNGSEQ